VLEVYPDEQEGFWWDHVQRDGHYTQKYHLQQTPSQARRAEPPEPEKMLVVAVFGWNLGLFNLVFPVFILLVLILFKLALLFLSN
jgi:hypothetical protein